MLTFFICVILWFAFGISLVVYTSTQLFKEDVLLSDMLMYTFMALIWPIFLVSLLWDLFEKLEDRVIFKAKEEDNNDD